MGYLPTLAARSRNDTLQIGRHEIEDHIKAASCIDLRGRPIIAKAVASDRFDDAEKSEHRHAVDGIPVVIVVRDVEGQRQAFDQRAPLSVHLRYFAARVRPRFGQERADVGEFIAVLGGRVVVQLRHWAPPRR
jgi:hypothetical protein